MAAVSLFWDTNMAAVTSCENTLYVSGELPSYPTPKPKFCPMGEVSVNVDLAEG